MIKSYRDKFNQNFTLKKYDALLQSLTKGLSSISFRIAETPVFIPPALKDKLIDAGEQIIKLIRQPEFKALTQNAIPPQWIVPAENDHPHFLTFDFAVCKDELGELTPKLIELQGFPSLYAFQPHLAKAYQQAYSLEEMAVLSPYFNDLNEADYVELLKKVVLGKYHPHQVALMDVDAPHQKTIIDFQLTHQLTGCKVLSLTDIFKEGKQLFYNENGKKIQLKRIYNRLIFDEISDKTMLFEQCFDPREDLDIEWATQPNWFYRISKYTMPFLKHDFVPETRFLNEINQIPQDLKNFVLKPLFSFAGQGVIIDVDQEAIKSISDPENWVLQRKVIYEPVIQAHEGNVKTEIRLMYLWPDGEEPQLCMNLVRLSRGKMIGVRYNKDFDWVGGSVGLMDR
ncbi:glutathionylspermidine synthase [Pedobacter sp. CG_S7]|uniref:hypothetical protein n=1 Tax=Pedobacter sp. CG_S7 TaxID=3143930 RepID=UPI00339760E0